MSERLEVSKIKQFETLMVEQQKTNKEEISKISDDLIKELSAERIIIKYTYLKESLERFTQDAEKLKELCAKFNIKGIKLSELEQKKDSNNKKRKYNIFSNCISDNAEEQEITHHIRQRRACCTVL